MEAVPFNKPHFTGREFLYVREALENGHVSGNGPFTQRCHEMLRQRYGYNPGVYPAIGYSTGQVLEAAVRLAGTTQPNAVREQLRTMEFRSLFGQYRVDENGRQEGKRNYVLQWQGGERKLVDPPNLAESQLIYPRR